MQKPIEIAIAKQELERINEILQEPHLLIGGLSVQQYNLPRKSKDIDLVCSHDTAIEILKLYPPKDWIINNSKDEYRPSYRITHRVADKGEIIFGPKILERGTYAKISWDILKKGSKPFSYQGQELINVHVPTVAALCFTKIISFIGRYDASQEKAIQDLKDFADLSNNTGFCINEFFDIIRKSEADDQIRTEFSKIAKNHIDILLHSSILSVTEVLGFLAPVVCQNVASNYLEGITRTGKRYKDISDSKIYLMLDGELRHIPNPSTYYSLFGNSSSVIDIESTSMFPVGLPLTDGAYLANGTPDGKVFLVVDGVKRWITNPSVFDLFGFNWNAIQAFSNDILSQLPDGKNVIAEISGN